MTHTYAVLEISRVAHDEIRGKLREAGYEHAFHEDVIDMHGIALSPATEEEEKKTMEALTFESLYGLLEHARKTKTLRVRQSWALASEAYILRYGKTEVVLLPNGWLDRLPAFRSLLMGELEWLRFLGDWSAQYNKFPPPLADPADPR